MIEQLRKLLETPSGRLGAIVVAVLFLLVSGFVVHANLKSETPAAAFHTMFICTETGKTFEHTNKIGETQPIVSPYSGKRTGVPAEACYWTADGGVKKSPTWVLLKELKGESGPTFCPDCGRLVLGHNPAPGAGVRVPPKQGEYGGASKRKSMDRSTDRVE